MPENRTEVKAPCRHQLDLHLSTSSVDVSLGIGALLPIFRELPSVLTSSWLVKGSLWDPLGEQLN